MEYLFSHNIHTSYWPSLWGYVLVLVDKNLKTFSRWNLPLSGRGGSIKIVLRSMLYLHTWSRSKIEICTQVSWSGRCWNVSGLPGNHFARFSRSSPLELFKTKIFSDWNLFQDFDEKIRTKIRCRTVDYCLFTVQSMKRYLKKTRWIKDS